MLTTLALSILIFGGVILTLVLILNVASAKLVPAGTVKISVNGGEKVIETQPGTNLLSALMEEDIYLPSACGGGGSCAMCKCQIFRRRWRCFANRGRSSESH